MTPEQYASSYTYSTLLKCARGVVTDAKVFTENMCIWLRDRTWEKGWFDEVHGAEKSAPTLTDFIEEKAPNGIGSTVPWVWATLETAKNLGVDSAGEARQLLLGEIPDAPKQLERAVAEAQPQARKKGRPKKGEEKSANGTLKRGTNKKDQTLARLKRDHPEIAERVVNGELSANAAAIEAGFRKKLTPLDTLTRAWAKASIAERQAFLASISCDSRNKA